MTLSIHQKISMFIFAILCLNGSTLTAHRVIAAKKLYEKLSEKATGFLEILNRSLEVKQRALRAATFAVENCYSSNVITAALLLEMSKNLTEEEYNVLHTQIHKRDNSTSPNEPMRDYYGHRIPRAAFPVLTAEFLRNDIAHDLFSLIKMQPVAGYWYGDLLPEGLKKCMTLEQNSNDEKQYNMYQHDRSAWQKLLEAERTIAQEKTGKKALNFDAFTSDEIVGMALCNKQRIIEDAPQGSLGSFRDYVVEALYEGPEAKFAK